MNRELRRAQAKAEAKAEKEKKRARAEKRAKRDAAVARRQRPKAKNKASDAKANTKDRPRNPPGRFAHFLTLFVAAFIVLQAITPILSELRGTQEVIQEAQWSGIVEILYYALFGYFAYLWAMKLNVNKALYVASGIGAALAIVLVTVQFIAAQQFPSLVPNLQLFYFGIPAVIGGAFLGQLVWHRAPR